MKMVMIVVPRDRADELRDKVIAQGYGATYLESRGGRLRQAQSLIFVAVEDSQVAGVLDTVRRTCRDEHEVQGSANDLSGNRAIQARVGHAVTFVWDLEQFEAVKSEG